MVVSTSLRLVRRAAMPKLLPSKINLDLSVRIRYLK